MAKFTSETGTKAGKKSKRGQNKLNREIKDLLANVVLDQITDNLEKDLNAMTERGRWQVIVGLLEYAIPKLSRQNIEQAEREEPQKYDLSRLSFEELHLLKYGRPPGAIAKRDKCEKCDKN